MIMLFCTAMVVVMLFFLTTSIVTKSILTCVMVGIIFLIYLESKMDVENVGTISNKSSAVSKKPYSTKKVDVKYTCYFIPGKDAETIPVVEGGFIINPVEVGFKPESRHYDIVAKGALEMWLYDHFTFTYNIDVEGERFNGTFKPAEFNSRIKKQAGHGKGDQNKKPSDS